MRRLRPTSAPLATLLCAVALLSLAACEDPSGVGLSGILDINENDPSARTIPAATASLDSLDDLTGAFASSAEFAAFRALAGRVDDPIYGVTRATAYLDVLPSQNLPSGFGDDPIDAVTIRLIRTYVYGDTLAPTRFDVRQVAEEWDAVGATGDTLFPVMDGVITSFDVAAGDSLIEVTLPDEWVEANDTTLRSDQFSTLFHGFQIAPQAGASAVYGFAGSSRLQLISGEDTVLYVTSELFSSIEAPPTPPSDPDRLLLQDGTGLGLGLDFGPGIDSLGSATINAAFLRVDADTAAASAPAGFVRPFARRLALYGVVDDEDADPVFITTATLDEETESFTFVSAALTAVFQDLVLDNSDVDRFVIGFLPSPSSVDVIPLAGPTSDAPPRAVIVLIPNED